MAVLEDADRFKIVQEVIDEIKNTSGNKVQNATVEQRINMLDYILALSSEAGSPMRKFPAANIETKINVIWDESSNINTYTTAGVYNIKGQRTMSSDEDNLPITNRGGGHTIHARLLVLDSSIESETNSDDKCITQILSMSNRVGGDGKIYIRTAQGRTKDELTWENWAELQTNVNVGQVSTLDTLIDNGIYSGVWTYGSHGSYPLTFVCVVINDYFVGVSPRRVSQFLYGLSKFDGSVLFQTRVGVGDTTIEWGKWKDINEDKIDKKINDAVNTLKVKDLGYNSNGVFLDSLVDEGLYRGGYYDGGVYKKFALTVIDNNYQDVHTISQFMQYNEPYNGDSFFVERHKAGSNGVWTDWQMVNKKEISDLVASEMNKIIEGTEPDTIDSIKDLVAWIEAHGKDAANMATAIKANTTDIANEVTRAKAEESKLVKKANEAAGVIDIKQTGVTGSDSYTYYQTIPVGTKLRLEWLTPSDVDTQIYASNGKDSKVLASFTNAKRVVEVETTDVITRTWVWGNYADRANVVNKYRVVFLDTPVVSVVEDVLKRIQGTSDNSNPSTDPFRLLIKVGDINQKDNEGNNKVLKALDALHSTSANDNLAGRWRIIASDSAYDVENVVTHYATEKWLQIFHGPFTISKTGFSFGSFDYKTSWRRYENGKWSDWQCREDDLVELTKGTSPNSPSTYSTPMFLGNFTDYAAFLAKLDDMHYNEKTTFKEGKGKCVGWFRAKAGTDYIDIKCVCRYVFGDNWQQVISGFFKLNSAGTLEASTTAYTTLFRNREGSYNSNTGVAIEGTWSAWKKITTVQ